MASRQNEGKNRKAVLVTAWLLVALAVGIFALFYYVQIA